MKFIVELFNSKTEVIEGATKEVALADANLSGVNKWMVFKVEPLTALTKPLDKIFQAAIKTHNTRRIL